MAIALYFLRRVFRGSVKHSVVQNAFLAKYTFDQLSQTQKKQVHEQTLQILKRAGLLEEDFPKISEMHKFTFYALAMEEQGISPALPGEKWHYVENPFMVGLRESEHQVQVVKYHLERNHNVKLDLEWGDRKAAPNKPVQRGGDPR
jgi:hypothetical protein